MSTFFGASARNRELKWIVTIDDSKAKSGLNDLKRGFTDLDTTTKTTTRNLGTMTQQQFQAIDRSAQGAGKQIEGFEDINPVVHVKFTGSGKISGSASGNIRVAQHGMHEILGDDTLIYAHKGEAVHIDRASGGYNSSSRGSNGSGSGQPIVVNNHIHMMDREIVRSFKSELGKGRSKFGL